MALSRQKAAKIAACTSVEAMRSTASMYGALSGDRIDFRGVTVRLRFRGIDLSGFVLDGANLSGSEFTNCDAPGVSFRECVLRDVRVSNEPLQRTTWENADFSETRIEKSYFGPATLGLQQTKFCGAMLRDTKFMLARAQSSDFSGASLRNVDFREANLDHAKFIDSKLDSVRFEGASLNDTDFTGASMSNMEKWGEPDYSRAIVSDDLRFRYVILRSPVKSLELASRQLDFDESQRRTASDFIEAVRDFADDASEAMVIYDEYRDIIEFETFVQLVKRAKTSEMNG